MATKNEIHYLFLKKAPKGIFNRGMLDESVIEKCLDLIITLYDQVIEKSLNFIVRRNDSENPCEVRK